MIGKMVYIRGLTPLQRKLMQDIADAEALPTGTAVLLFVLEKYNDKRNEVARLNRFLEMKNNKIEALREEIEHLKKLNNLLI